MLYNEDMFKIRLVKKNQILLYQGEATASMYRVKKGLVRAYTVLENGSELIISISGPGDNFPASVHYDKAPTSMFYYEMMSEGEIEVYSLDEFQGFIESNKDEAQKNARRYVGALLHINAIGQSSAIDKLVHTLRYLAVRFGIEYNTLFTRIDIKLTQSDIAKLANMSRETVSIEMKKLKAKNLVIEKNKYYAVNLSGINKFIGDSFDESIL